MIKIVSLLLFLQAWSLFAAPEKTWRTYHQVEYIASEYADGDSFPVNLGGEVFVLRLYYVDCPETTNSSDSDLKRLREQGRYFGTKDGAALVKIGKKATAFVAEQLAKPFTVQTVKAGARGRSAKPRIYALVTTADGIDLGTELVRRGYARSHGVSRELPDGTSGADHRAYLDDLELSAAVGKAGAWKLTDPEKLVELREDQRREMRDLKVAFGSFSNLSEEHKLDLNAATSEELQQIKGIGEKLAGEIIKARPFKSVEELDDVKGIGPSLMKNARPYLFVK